jgi:hypothetical protein
LKTSHPSGLSFNKGFSDACKTIIHNLLIYLRSFFEGQRIS